jgi:DNA-binding CsgD family transcriptional regulator/tetratricopeptide (TPR) repeat protein
MASAGTDLGSRVVGREAELANLSAFLGRDYPRSLVLTGGPGMGKTTLWEAAVDEARRRGLRVLSARPSDAEATLAFAALIDLFDSVGSDELAALPVPQRDALEVPLLRAVPTGPAPEAQAIAVGVLSALRVVAARGPILVAVDDTQWLDTASAAALVFAARRLDDDDVRFLLARRVGAHSSFEQAFTHEGVEHLEVGPLSLGGTRRLLHDRLGLTLSRQLMRRIFDATLGNPLFALEVARTLVAEGVPVAGESLPVPDAVEDLLGMRVAGLPRAQLRLLLAVALSQDPRVGQLTALPDGGALADAVEAGVLVVDGDHVRAFHPLVAAAATRRSRAAERRELHGALAATLPDGERRTRHLALAAAQPDRALAAEVASAAASAAARGAPQAAVELAEHALRLTPPDDAVRAERLLELAAYLEVAGEKRRVTELLEPALEWLPSGTPRARAYLLLASGVIESNDDLQRYFERAFAESGNDRRMRSSVLAVMAEVAAAVRVERVRQAEAWALEALPARSGTDARLERSALYALGWARSLSGRPIDDVCARFRAASPTAPYLAESPERIAGQRLVWRGEIAAARDVLTEQLRAADERGEPSSYALQRLHVCELELRAGDWDAAEQVLDEWAESAERELLHWPMYERCRALLAAGRGQVEEARRWADEALERARERGVRWDELEALRALAIADLLARRPGRAVERLRVVWEHTEREGVEDPGAFPVAPELVEAHVELDELVEAEAVLARLAALSDAQDHPWGHATTLRCQGLVRLARSYDEEGCATLEVAAAQYSTLALAFDRARTLLALGRAQRRARKWGAARETLSETVSSFGTLGSRGWAEAARSELSRVGARRPPLEGELSVAERRVAELAAGGLTNKEIAQTLVVTVSTVEYHLSRAYARLGIRSRAQLASRLAEMPPRA